jgi:disulfide bond formation protein DsbB
VPSLSFRDITPWRAAVVVFVGATAMIVGAWIFQSEGFLPCELCLKDRWFYYSGIPLAALVAVIASRGPKTLVLPGLLLLAVVFAGSAIFGVYHAGVEWHFWRGPTECTGPINSASFDLFQQQLQNSQGLTQIVRCDVVELRILGLSLAGWNAVLSAVMCVVALVGARNAAGKK